MKKKKLIIAVLSVLLAAVLSLNIVWGIYALNYNKKYVSKFDIPVEYSAIYFVDDDKFTYSATNTNYLSFTENLAVTDKENNSLIIWITLSGLEYGIMLNNDSYQMYVDKNGKPVGKRNVENVQEMYIEHKETIDELINRANKFWEIGD